MLKLEHIVVMFNGHNALNNVSCSVHEGDFISIVGSNGAGKTTLFDVISGKTNPSTGSVFLEGKSIHSLSERHRAQFIARLFQNPFHNCAPSMTVGQNLALALYKNITVGLTNGMKQCEQRDIASFLKKFGFDYETIKNKQMLELSGGQRQLISFIMAILIRPRILLLDEPTAALDPAAATRLLSFAIEYIKQHKITTMLITHDPHIARAIGNKLWVLENGQVTKQFSGTEKETVSTDDLIGHIDYGILAKL